MTKIKRTAKQMSGLVLALALLAGGLAPQGRAQERTIKPSPTQGKDFEAESHVPDPPGKIAFASDRGGNFEIYVMNPDGGGLVQVTDNPAEDTHPTWSPDGTKIAFVSNRDGNKEIYVVNADGGGATRLTNNPAEDITPAWSQASANPKIAFVSNRDGQDEIYTMNPDGTLQTNVSQHNADDVDPAWAPSGTLLSFSSNRDGDKFEIYRMGADGSSQVRLTNNSANDVAPTWSSGRITFQTDRDGNDELYTMNVDGTNQTRVTDNPAFDLDPARPPDGGRIVWTSSRSVSDNLDIYASNADGSNVVRLTNDPASDIVPAVQPLPSSTILGTIQLSAASYTVAEGQAGIDITVTRAGGTGSAALDFETVSGTASDRTDFTPVFSTLTFATGETSKTVHIPIIDDAFVEGDETFTVTLSNVVNSILGSPANAVVTIIDNDTTTTATIFGVTTGNNLVRFNSTTPATIDATLAITGLQAGETVRGIDVRPATRQLYALGSTNRLYVINPTTGAATPASNLSVGLNGTEFGVDFNPTVDRLRVVSDADQNLRINVDSGAVTVDTTLAYAAGDPNASANPNIVGSAYTNNFAGATSTTLYSLDSNLDRLVIQNPPNSGTLNTVGALGVDTSALVGFDIARSGGVAFASLTAPGDTTSKLYTLNLATGGATLVGSIATNQLIRDIAVATTPANPIDETEFFVRQQYLDFLSREPDAAGLNFWTNQLTVLIANCNSQPNATEQAKCVLGARALVSTAFFLSIEFQQSGYLVIRLYQEAFGRVPTLREFLADAQEIRQGVIIGQPGAAELLEANKRAFLDSFVRRPAFAQLYDGVSNANYVNALFNNAGVDPATEAATRDALIAGLNNGTETRATVLLKVADTKSVFNAHYNRAVVLMQYFGYLRRNPSDPPDMDLSGFNFWLSKLNQFSLPGEDVRDSNVALARIKRAQMVEAFIDSSEYRRRFGQP